VNGSALERRFRQEARRSGIPRDVVEKDFVLSYVLAGIAGVEQLAAALVFKGGTALRKCYFADYRYSEDLDFTGVETSASPELGAAIEKAAGICRELLLAVGAFEVTVDRYPQGTEHPDGQQAFRVHVQFPWQRQPLCSVKIEVTFDEPLLLSHAPLRLMHEGDAPPESELSCYALEEIVAEKLRALLQTKAHLDRHGWARPRSRDYYDLWQLLVERPASVDWTLAGRLLPQKCEVRGVGYQAAADFFVTDVIDRARAEWTTDLRRLVARVPDFDRCLDDLRPEIERIVAEG